MPLRWHAIRQRQPSRAAYLADCAAPQGGYHEIISFLEKIIRGRGVAVWYVGGRIFRYTSLGVGNVVLLPCRAISCAHTENCPPLPAKSAYIALQERLLLTGMRFPFVRDAKMFAKITNLWYYLIG